MVGALVVSRGRVIGRGYHHAAGQPHAEVLALRQAGRRARGGTLYVTLEPCSHLNKRTPPCVPAIIRAGIHRVVVAMVDPNPLVRGRGVAQLRRAGIPVTVGIGRAEAEEMNKAYSHWVRTGRPYVTLKAGMTLDGRIAAESGASRWITGPASRQEGHRLRREVDAVLVGIGTVLADDPALTARRPPGLVRPASKQPLRVVLDSRLRIPRSAAVLARQQQAPTLVVTTAAAPRAKRLALARKGVDVLTAPATKGRVRLAACLKQLGKRGITHVLLEGGSELNAAFLKAGLVNRVRFYVAPALLGGARSIGVIGGRSPASPAQARPLHHLRIRPLGTDFVIEGELQPH
ncbi:Riboflavin biosynthesis protein RibD [Nitrospira moscoviensis]|uniref:Riboflavin biosynthesis protein RibD n=2 Tax=Nitrospira moscoviensis TaxID=42253 RepID=A0A0K2GFG4_NITMO|nr:Riboflavin biosynthesis protein RibD [Nitrospira moscoviensis]